MLCNSTSCLLASINPRALLKVIDVNFFFLKKFKSKIVEDMYIMLLLRTLDKCQTKNCCKAIIDVIEEAFRQGGDCLTSPISE